jgi:acyl-CoA thioester hydrolase
VSNDIGARPILIETEIRVRYAETDAMGVVHHASYVVWLELGRSELLRARGLPYRQIEARGYFVMLSALNVRYLGAAQYDDLVVLRTELTAVRSRQIVFGYHIRKQAGGAALVTAESVHTIVARDSGRPARLPEDLFALLGNR